MPDETPPEKRDVARALLLRGSMYVYLDPRIHGVMVPEWLRNQHQLVLEVGLDMPVPIVDLRVDAEGVSGTLSFNRSPYRCVVPWRAIYALFGDDGRTGMAWRDDLPPEIEHDVETGFARGRKAPAPALTAVPGGASADSSGVAARIDETPVVVDLPRDAGPSERTDPDPPESEARKKPIRAGLPPYLRVIK